MNTSNDYERLGGLFLGTLNLPIFFNPARGPLERQSRMVMVDPALFLKEWSKSSGAFLAPPSIESWDSYALVGKQADPWRLVSGPGRSLQLPYAYYNEDRLVLGSSVFQMRALIDWGAAAIPVMTSPKDCPRLQKTAGSRYAQQTSWASEFVIDFQPTIAAFRCGMSPYELYANPKRERPANNMVEAVADYAALIDFQLASAALRYTLFRSNTVLVSDQNRDELPVEVRQMLYRRDVIGDWLYRPDLSHLPDWAPDAMESSQTAFKYLAQHMTTSGTNSGHHLNVVASTLADTALHEAKNPRKRPKPMLRLVRPDNK